MAQLVIYYDPKDRLQTGHERFPSEIMHASIKFERVSEDPEELEAMAKELASLLLASIPV